MDLVEEIYVELDRAEAARVKGNEGRACVCARRAAGMAARDFLNRTQSESPAFVNGRIHSGSVYEALQILASHPALDPVIKQALIFLTMQVNEDFLLPEGIDLINEARTLIERLK